MPCAASAPNDDLFDQLLTDRGHETEPARWDRSYSKLQYPDCEVLCDMGAATCSVYGWVPEA